MWLILFYNKNEKQNYTTLLEQFKDLTMNRREAKFIPQHIYM
jgi:hypothetical protein